MKPSDIPKSYMGVPQSPKSVRVEEITEYLLLTMPHKELMDSFTDSCDYDKDYNYIMRMVHRNLRRWVQSLPEERQAHMWLDMQGKMEQGGPRIAPEQFELPLGYEVSGKHIV